MEEFKYISESNLYSPIGFVARLPNNICTTNQLFKELSLKLNFPSYFGYNWDALLDCFCDFNWIEEYNISLIHNEVPKLDNQNLKTYIMTLKEAIITWRNATELKHRFEVIFLLKEKNNLLL